MIEQSGWAHEFMEEFRLAKQVDNEGQIGMMNAMKPEAPIAAPAPPAPIINVNSPQISPTNINTGEPEPAPVDPIAALLGGGDIPL